MTTTAWLFVAFVTTWVVGYLVGFLVGLWSSSRSPDDELVTGVSEPPPNVRVIRRPPVYDEHLPPALYDQDADGS